MSIDTQMTIEITLRNNAFFDEKFFMSFLLNIRFFAAAERGKNIFPRRQGKDILLRKLNFLRKHIWLN